MVQSDGSSKEREEGRKLKSREIKINEAICARAAQTLAAQLYSAASTLSFTSSIAERAQN